MAMRWEDERYVKLYTRDTVGWKLLPWQGKALLPLLTRKVDRAGLIDLGEDGVDGLAALVELPPEVVEVGFSALLRRGTLELKGGVLIIPNFTEAQEAHASDAQRKRDQRERDRDLARFRVLNGEAKDPGTVYFARAISGGPVKIGYTEQSAKDRLSVLQTAHPEKLVLIHCEPGAAARELELHQKFAHLRLQGEWFRWSQEIEDYVTPRDLSVTRGHAASRAVTPRVDESKLDETRVDETKRSSSRDEGAFDFDLIYQLYPRKLGKAKGLERCKQQIKTLDDFEKCKRAAGNYAKAKQHDEARFVKHFDAWMNGHWRDWVDPPQSEFGFRGNVIAPKFREPIGPQAETKEEAL